MMGVPAGPVGWVSHRGIPLPKPDAGGIMVCPERGYRYREVEPGVVRCLDPDEEAPLANEQRVGRVSYRGPRNRTD